MAAVPSFRQRRSSLHAMGGTSNRYAPDTTTALSIISRNIRELSKKQNLICQIKQSLEAKKVKCLDMEHRQVLSLDDRVMFQINMLEKLFEHFSKVRTTANPLKFISYQLQDLHQLDDLTSRVEEELRRDGRMKRMELQYLDSKSEVVYCIDVLEKIYQEISLAQLSLSSTKPGRGFCETFHLNFLLSKSRGLAEISAFQAKTSNRLFEEYQPRTNDSKQIRSVGPLQAGARGLRCTHPYPDLRSEGCVRKRSTNETKINQMEPESLNKQRYLCITNGFEIFCLDLKQSKDQTFNNANDVPFIPRIAILDLWEENLPTTGGLFKWRSSAYMIGGHKSSESSEENSMGRDCRSYCSYEFCAHTIKGTSCLTHGLSLSDYATLSHSESKNIWRLKKPKAWPIVEEINGQIHVIDSAPDRYDSRCSNWLFSHEVFNPDTGIWADEIIMSKSSLSEDMYSKQIPALPNSGNLYCIKSYLVLGDRIYAASEESFLVFDSNEREWEEHPRGFCKCCQELPDLRHRPCWCVGRFLRKGPCRCVGRYTYGGEPLYVVLALEEGGCSNPYVGPVGAVAYLVTSTGQILCFQRLTHFFKGPVWPVTMLGGTIIQVDDDKVEEKTMCSIVKGKRLGGDTSPYLFINTFTLEMLSDAAPMIRERLAGGSDPWRMPPSSYVEEQGSELLSDATSMIEGLLPYALPRASDIRRMPPSYTKDPDFVRVHPKDSYIYRMDDVLGLGLDSYEWAGMRACFF